MFKIWLCATWAFAQPLLAASSPKPLQDIFDIEGSAQGTTYHIRYTGSERPELKKQVDDQLAAFDKIFSNYRPDSEISLFNQQTSSNWIPVHPNLLTLVELSHSISEQTHGAFDITIGALMKVWGFGPFKKKLDVLPSDKEIAAAKKNVDYRQLLTRKSPPALKKTNPNLYVDVSGIAQGYSVDLIAEFLDSLGLKNYMVEIGGEIKARGQKPAGKEWELALEDPSMEPLNAARVHVVNKGLTTAGDYRDYFEKDGKRFSHTIDPRIGKPIQHTMASVTVIANSAAEADGWDTALLVMGPEETRKLTREKKLAALMILRKDGRFTTEMMGGFERYLIKK